MKPWNESEVPRTPLQDVEAGYIRALTLHLLDGNGARWTLEMLHEDEMREALDDLGLKLVPKEEWRWPKAPEGINTPSRSTLAGR